MALTEAEICNLALLAIGERETIDNLGDPTTAAQVATSIYPQARDLVLEAHWWSFAKKSQTLALSVETVDGWGYTYAWPADCLAPRYIYPGTRTPTATSRIPFAQGLNAAGTGFTISSDQNSASTPVALVYTARVVNTGLFPPSFVEALSMYLASKFALAISVKPAMGVEFMRIYKMALSEAVASDFRKNQEDQLPDSELITTRY